MSDDERIFRPIDDAAPEQLITQAGVTMLGRHAVVRVWINHGFAGSLTMSGYEARALLALHKLERERAR